MAIIGRQVGSTILFGRSIMRCLGGMLMLKGKAGCARFWTVGPLILCDLWELEARELPEVQRVDATPDGKIRGAADWGCEWVGE